MVYFCTSGSLLCPDDSSVVLPGWSVAVWYACGGLRHTGWWLIVRLSDKLHSERWRSTSTVMACQPPDSMTHPLNIGSHTPNQTLYLKYSYGVSRRTLPPPPKSVLYGIAVAFLSPHKLPCRRLYMVTRSFQSVTVSSKLRSMVYGSRSSEIIH